MKDRFADEDLQLYSNLKTEESEWNDLTAEEFPEGPYGSDLVSESLGKSSPWRLEQRAARRFGYEDREQHAGLGRDYPGEDDFISSVPEVQDEP